MSKRRTTGRHADECPACYGFGQNEKCATVTVERTVTDRDGQQRTILKTTQLGSGCLRCGGIGRLSK